jgi:hypothetical protein
MLRLIAYPGLIALLVAAGCGGGTANRVSRCTPQVGMNSAELVACGCRPDQPRASSAGVISDSLGDRAVTTIVNLRYLCHDPGAGFVWVSVTNGVADAVYR